MDYLRRFFSSGGGIEEPLPYPHTTLEASYPSYTSPIAVGTAVGTAPSPHISWDPQTHTSPRRRHHHKHKQKHTRGMGLDSFSGPSFSGPSFSGPSCKNLVDFMTSIKDMPNKYKTSFDNISKNTIETICDPEALHVWESDSDLDGLLQLTQVVVKLKNMLAAAKAKVSQNGRRSRDAAGAAGAAMIIIAEEKKGRNNFDRIVELVRHLTGAEGRKHLNGTVCAFDNIVVVRGVDYTNTTDASATVKRINTCIERVFKSDTVGENRKLIWHHGPTLSLLLTWINTTTPSLRSTLRAVSITALLDIASGLKPSPLAHNSNKPSDLQRLHDYANKLSIPVLFLDPGSLLIVYEYLPTYMYFWAYYAHTLLPSSVLRKHLDKGLDELITFSFRLRGASEAKYGSEVVRMVQSHLDAGKAKRWAKNCVSPASYTKQACRGAAEDECIHRAVQLADSPFALLEQIPGYAVPAFSRLMICPAAAGTSTSTTQYYIAAPVSFDFKNCSFRAEAPSPFHILLPQPGQDVETVTARIQGTMMAVLERVRQDKGMPRLGEKEREVWSVVGRACKWALQGVSEGRAPEGVREKVGFVREKLEGGTYGFAVGTAKKGGLDGQGQGGRWSAGGGGGGNGVNGVGTGVWG